MLDAEAANHLTIAIALNPEDVTLYSLRSKVESHRCHLNAAIADAQAAVKLDTGDSTAFLR